MPLTFYPEGTRILPSDDELRTLHKIASLNGAGSGASPGTGYSGVQQVFIDRAPSAPDNPLLPAINYATGGSSAQQWDVATQAWV